MTHVVIVTGAGGVGKTTIAAALAIQYARTGARTMVITIDPAKRLADALGVGELRNDPAPVPEEPGLDAAMLDVTASWEDIIHRYADPDVAARLLVNPYFRAIADRFPAAQAYAAGERMASIVESGHYDVLVLDTPPSGGGIDFFRAPKGTRDLVSGRLLKWLTGSHLPGRSVLFRLTARPILRIADTVLGGPMLSDVADFLLDLRTTYDQLANRSKAIERHLGRAQVHVVTTADPAPLHETRRFFDELATVNIEPTAIIFNRMLPSTWLGPVDVPEGTNPLLVTNLASWAAESRRQRDAARELETRHGVPVHRIEWAVPPPTGLDQLAALVDGRDLLTELHH